MSAASPLNLWRMAIERVFRSLGSGRKQPKLSRLLRRRLVLDALEDRTLPSGGMLPIATAPLPKSSVSSITASPPRAVDDWTDTDGRTPVAINVLANDSAAPGRFLRPGSVRVFSLPGHGAASVNPSTGQITYRANAGFTGTDSFRYLVQDSRGLFSNVATVSVRVNRPTAADDWSDTDGSTPVAVDVLANDTDPDGNQHLLPGSVRVVTGPSRGSVSVDHATGQIIYTAKAGFTGTDSFAYTVADDHGATSNVARAFVQVNRPTAADDWTDTDGTTPVTIDVLANDTDPDGNLHLLPSSVAVVSGPSHGSVSVDPSTGQITYTANPGFTGTDSFRYTVSDDHGATSAPATVFVRINRPTAADDSAQALGTTPVVIDLLANDTDPDGNQHLLPSSVAVVSGPSHGSFSIDPSTGQITYTANAGFTGTDSFRYTVSDDNGATSNPATVVVTVLHTGPGVNDDWIDVDGGNRLGIAVLANDSAAPGRHFLTGSVKVVSGPSHGTVTVNLTNGHIIYQANPGFTGTDTFRYTVRDSAGQVSSPATVSVRVNRPTAADDWIDTDGRTPVAIDVLGNDTDPDGNQHLLPSSVRVVSLPSHGTVSINHTTGQIIYRANGGFTGTDSFSYTVADDHGARSHAARVLVRVNRPTAADDWTDTDGTTPVTIDVLANDTDPDGNQHLLPSSVVIVTGPSHGAVTVDPSTGQITYTAKPGFTGTDSFRYQVSDDNGAKATPATVFVRVNRPTAADDFAQALGTTPVAIDVLANDTDPDGNQHLLPGSVTIVSLPSHGTVSVNPSTGQISYTANAGFTGTDTFRYTVSDDNGATSRPATVVVIVQGPQTSGLGGLSLATLDSLFAGSI